MQYKPHLALTMNNSIVPKFLPPASAVEVIETEPFVCVCVCECVCVCLFVSALTAEPFDIWSQNLVQGLTSSLGLWCDVMTSHDIMGSRRDAITPEVQQHFSVFVFV